MATKISAKVVADSITQDGDRITTMVITFPRMILAEFNTHRVFSKNTSSSRAIPFGKMVDAIKDDPFIPIAWQKDHKGMQGTRYITDPRDIENCVQHWLDARDHAVGQAERLHEWEDVTKQICNRLLEPFMWTTMIVTSTEWDNFFDLRCPSYVGKYKSWSQWFHEAKPNRDVVDSYDDDPFGKLKANEGQAEIHMMALAEAMFDARNESTPVVKQPGEWHIPFGNLISDPFHESIISRIQISTAMCARTSYTVVGIDGTNDKKENFAADIKLHDNLLDSKHLSPFEHCARAPFGKLSPEDERIEILTSGSNTPHEVGVTHVGVNEDTWSGNLRGWIQYRHLLPSIYGLTNI